MRAAGQERREEVSSKMSRVRGYLAEAGLDGVLLSRRDNFAWLTAGGDNHVVGTTEGGVATLLIAKDAARIVATNIEMQRLLEEEPGPVIFYHTFAQ